jgi:glutathione gamma-glutamylcysteinyltransferase
MESYFPLAEQFITQSDPSYCSLSTLAMVLNALNFDPKKIWKGSWRWVSEEMLQCETEGICGHSLERVKKVGLSFSEFESLGHCHGVKIQSFRVKNPSDSVDGSKEFEEFRDLLINVSSNDQANRFLVVNFSRKYLNQTGDGHYSPIGGYHKEKDLALVMDVARFKYPPYWVKLTDLWDSMSVKDKSTGESRGYFLISGWEINNGEMKTHNHIIEATNMNHKNCSQHHNHQHHL